MNNLFKDLTMRYHFLMAMHNYNQFKKHYEKHTEIFMKKHPGMLQKQNGLHVETTMIDEIHTEHSYKKQEGE